MLKNHVKESPQTFLLIADSRILAIPIKENHDEMIDLVNLEEKELSYGPSPEIENNTCYTKMRKTVYEKLKLAQSYLPRGIKFCLYEAYRSLSLQASLFEERYNQTKQLHPQYNLEELFQETIKMVSPVINFDGSTNIPPHSTGAAVDVYLIDSSGKPLDMGIHPKDWMKDKENLYSPTHSDHISKEAQQNRDIMSGVLMEVGFVNYPTEYWHWSYGDRYWAYHQQAPYALYGTI